MGAIVPSEDKNTVSGKHPTERPQAQGGVGRRLYQAVLKVQLSHCEERSDDLSPEGLREATLGAETASPSLCSGSQ